MANSTTLEYLTEIDEALARNSPAIDGAIDTVLDQQVTDYPILVCQRGAEVEIGVLLLARADPGAWEVRVTTLEEMVAKQLLRPDRVAEFRKVFHNARQQYCLFVVSDQGATFALRPRG